MTLGRYALLQSIAFAAIGLLALAPLAFAASTELDKMQAQMLSPSVQLNENCSGTIILSEKGTDGLVTNLVLTAKHCVTGSPLERQSVDVPVYKDLRIVKTERYYGKVLGQALAADLALVKLDDTDTVFRAVGKVTSEKPFLAYYVAPSSIYAYLKVAAPAAVGIKPPAAKTSGI